jgi:hypothetical protein
MIVFLGGVAAGICLTVIVILIYLVGTAMERL